MSVSEINSGGYSRKTLVPLYPKWKDGAVKAANEVLNTEVTEDSLDTIDVSDGEQHMKMRELINLFSIFQSFTSLRYIVSDDDQLLFHKIAGLIMDWDKYFDGKGLLVAEDVNTNDEDIDINLDNSIHRGHIGNIKGMENIVDNSGGNTLNETELTLNLSSISSINANDSAKSLKSVSSNDQSREFHSDGNLIERGKLDRKSMHLGNRRKNRESMLLQKHKEFMYTNNMNDSNGHNKNKKIVCNTTINVHSYASVKDQPNKPNIDDSMMMELDNTNMNNINGNGVVESDEGSNVDEANLNDADTDCKHNDENKIHYYQSVDVLMKQLSDKYHCQFRKVEGYKMSVRKKRMVLYLKRYTLWGDYDVIDNLSVDDILSVHKNWSVVEISGVRAVCVPESCQEPIVTWSWLDALQDRPSAVPAYHPEWFPVEIYNVFRDNPYLTVRLVLLSVYLCCVDLIYFMLCVW